MALNSYPFENANTTEDQYTLLFRNFADDGVVGNYNDDSFKVSTDGSGLDVQVAAGYAILRGHAVQNDGPITVNLDAADTANPRVDRLVLRLDPVADGISLVVIKGTPNANPATPPLTRTNTGVWDLPLASIRVPTNALNVVNENITSERVWGGHKFGIWRTEERPLNPYVGKPGFNVTLNGAEVWNGTTWESVVTKKKITVPHTWTLIGPVVVANAAGDYWLPPFFTPNVSGQTVKIVGTKSQVFFGQPGSSFNFDIRAGDVAQVQATATKAASTHSPISGTPAAVAGGVPVQLVVTGIVGDPKNASVTVYLEYEV